MSGLRSSLASAEREHYEELLRFAARMEGAAEIAAKVPSTNGLDPERVLAAARKALHRDR